MHTVLTQHKAILLVISTLFTVAALLFPLLSSAQTVTLNPPNPHIGNPLNVPYVDPGGVLTDADGRTLDWNLVETTSNVNFSEPGSYQIIYKYGTTHEKRFVGISAAQTPNAAPVIMDALYDEGGTGWGPWEDILCDTSGGAAPVVPTGTGTLLGTAPPSGTVSDADARTALAPYATIWESSPGATSLDGLQQHTLDGVISMAQDSGLDPTAFIVLGTESGYDVDFEANAQMNNYIETSFTEAGTRGGDPRYTSTINDRPVECVQESTHWDCLFLGTLDGTLPLSGTVSDADEPDTSGVDPNAVLRVFTKPPNSFEYIVPWCLPNNSTGCFYSSTFDSAAETVRAGEIWSIRFKTGDLSDRGGASIYVARAERGETLNAYDVSISTVPGDYVNVPANCVRPGGLGQSIRIIDAEAANPFNSCPLESNTEYYFNTRPAVGTAGEYLCGTPGIENRCLFRILFMGGAYVDI